MSDEPRRTALSWGGVFLALFLLAGAADRIGDRGFEGRCGNDESEAFDGISLPPLSDGVLGKIASGLFVGDHYYRSPPEDPLMEYDESSVFAGQIPSALGPKDPIVVVFGHSLFCGTAGCKAYILEWIDGDWRVAIGITAYNFIDEAVVWAAKGPVRGQWPLENNKLSAPKCIQPPAHGRPLLVSQTDGFIWRDGQWRYFCRRCDAWR